MQALHLQQSETPVHEHDHERPASPTAKSTRAWSSRSRRLTSWAPAKPELAHRQLAMAFHAAPIGMAVTTDHGVMVQCNPALGTLLGHRPEQLLGRRLEDLADHAQAEAISKGRRQMLDQGQDQHVAVSSLRHADGHQVPVSLSCSLVPSQPATNRANHVAAYLVVHVLDVSERQATEAELTHRALHDPLTGLPNRGLLLDRLDVALARLRRHPSTVAVLFCDLNGFKQINDIHGHTAGDQVLAEVARRLQQLQRPGDTACRFGGDEFVVLCSDSGQDEADSVAARLHAALTAPVLVQPAPDDDRSGPLPVTVSASIGIATTTDPHLGAHQLLHDADTTMYQAKIR